METVTIDPRIEELGTLRSQLKSAVRRNEIFEKEIADLRAENRRMFDVIHENAVKSGGFACLREFLLPGEEPTCDGGDHWTCEFCRDRKVQSPVERETLREFILRKGYARTQPDMTMLIFDLQKQPGCEKIKIRTFYNYLDGRTPMPTHIKIGLAKVLDCELDELPEV